MNLEAMIRGLQNVFKEYLLKNPKLSKELGMQVEAIRDLKHLVDVIAANMPFSFEDAQELLEETNLMRRYELLIYKIVNEIQAQKVKEEIQSKVKERVDKNQREYILREELKVIREELGDDNTMSDADEFQQAVDALKASKEVKEKLNKEIKRFRNSMNSPAEVGVIRTYIETMLEMPWDKTCKEHKDIAFARQVLDEDHYGLEKVKRACTGISCSACAYEKRRSTDHLSGGSSGNRKDIHCEISFQSSEETICQNLTGRCP